MFTLYNSDCLTVMKSMQSKSVDCIITDPPYGTRTDQRDEWMVGEFSNIMPLALPEIHRIGKGNAAIYFFTSWKWMADWVFRCSPYFRMQNFIIWDKGRHSGTYGKFSWQFHWEGVFFGIKGKRPIYKYSPDVLRSPNFKPSYPMEKPVDILIEMILASTLPDEVVFDPFMGTGSTGVACKITGRRFIGCEIDQKFFSIAEKRISEAVLEQRYLTPSNNRLHMDAGDSPAFGALSTLGDLPASENESTPAPCG